MAAIADKFREVNYQGDQVDGAQIHFTFRGSKDEAAKCNNGGLEAIYADGLVRVLIRKHRDNDPEFQRYVQIGSGYTQELSPGNNIYECWTKMEKIIGPLKPSQNCLKALKTLVDVKESLEDEPTFERVGDLFQRLVGKTVSVKPDDDDEKMAYKLNAENQAAITQMRQQITSLQSIIKEGGIKGLQLEGALRQVQYLEELLALTIPL